jgi:hypothetical protein
MHGSLEVLFRCVAATNIASAAAYGVSYARAGWLGAVARTNG